MDGVIRVVKNKQEGDTIPKNAYGTLNQIALRVFVKAQDCSSLNLLKRKIRQTIKIYSSDNEDIVI